MKEFHCILQVAPTELPAFRTTTFDGMVVNSLPLSDFATRFKTTFEAAAAGLESMPRFFFEPDGSFVWVVESEQRYQLDGSLYDDGTSLLNVELKGRCSSVMLDDFLKCLGWPAEKLLFQLVQHGIYMTEDEFRRHYVG